MKKNVLTTATMMLMAFGTFTLMNCKEEKTTSTIENKGENTVYACPMHPEETGKIGDKCSKCGMDLTPITGEDHKEDKH